MKSPSRALVAALARMGPRFLPFADAASPDLPLSRLLRLSLFQVSVGMALVLLVGTLVGILPGLGATLASFLAYTWTRQSSKTPKPCIAH